MPIRLSFLERMLLLNLNQGPGPLLDIWSGIAFHAVLTADRLGVFEALAEGPSTVSALAQRLNTDPRGTAMLLEALFPLGYLIKEGEQYANSAMTSKWFTSDASSNFAPYMQFWGDFLEVLGQDFENTIRQGAPAVNLYEWIEGQPQTAQHFQRGMVAIAELAGKEVADKLVLPKTPLRLLDVGGGHGAYSIALCQRYPQLTATIFDSPEALNTAHQVITEAGLTKRISLQPGSFLHDELGTDYDVILLFNIIHGFTPEQNQDLFQKVARALCVGGQIAVLEQITDGKVKGISQIVNGILGLAYFFTLGGQVYSAEEIERWMRTAGFRDIKRIQFRVSTGSSLLIGEK